MPSHSRFFILHHCGSDLSLFTFGRWIRGGQQSASTASGAKSAILFGATYREEHVPIGMATLLYM